MLIVDAKAMISKKNKCNYKINYMANGDAFITKPGKNIFLAKKL